MARIKVLHVAASYFPDVGGFPLRLARLLEPLAGKYEFHVLVPKKDHHGRNIYQQEVKNREIINGVIVHRVEKLSDIRGAVRRICKQYKINIIHAHYGGLSLALASLLAFTGKPLIYEVHAVSNANILKRLLAYPVYWFSNKVIVLSFGAKEIITEIYKISPRKTVIIPNGVNHDEFFSSKDGEKSSNSSQPLTIGYIGTFYPWEGVTVLVKAFSRIIRRCDAKLLLVGEGPTFVEVKRLVNELNLESKVSFTGMVAPSEVPNYLSAMDIFVIPRFRTIETETATPLKLLEAMAAGKAIVATDVKGVTEVIRDREDGILVPPADEMQLAKAILVLLEHESMRRKLGEQARVKVKEQFSWNASCTKLDAVYEELIKTGRRI